MTGVWKEISNRINQLQAQDEICLQMVRLETELRLLESAREQQESDEQSAKLDRRIFEKQKLYYLYAAKLIIPIFQDLRANASEIKNASISRIVRADTDLGLPASYVTSHHVSQLYAFYKPGPYDHNLIYLKLEWGNKFEPTDRENDIIVHGTGCFSSSPSTILVEDFSSIGFEIYVDPYATTENIQCRLRSITSDKEILTVNRNNVLDAIAQALRNPIRRKSELHRHFPFNQSEGRWHDTHINHSISSASTTRQEDSNRFEY